MSLLNDVLRDLAAQQQKILPSNSDAELDDFSQSSLRKQPATPWRSSLVVFIIILLVCFAAKALWHNWKNQQNIHSLESRPQQMAAAEPTNFLAENKASATRALAATEVAVSEVAANEVAAVEVAAVEVEKNSRDLVAPSPPVTAARSLPQPQHEHQSEIQQLMQSAKLALARDRLTSPMEDNAYAYYQQILSLEPENRQATQGLVELADRYLAIAKASLAEGNLLRAKTLAHRAQLVAPEYPPVQIFNAELQVAVAPDPVMQNQTQTQTQSALVAAVTAEAGADASGSLAQDLASTSAGGQTQLRVAPNKHWLDLQQVRLAQQLNAQGDAAGAIAALQGFLQHQPEASESSQLLLEIYCQQGRARDAQQLLAQAEFLSPGARQYFAARLALLAQDEPAAIALLEQQLDAAGVNENYRSLLAGLYQKQGSYGKAAASYYSLLKDFGEKPGLLLGYALALDALAQKPGALQAYRRLVEYQDLQTEVRSYAEQRIAALSS